MTFIRDDRGDMLTENMVGVMVVAASLIAGLWAFSAFSESVESNAQNQNLTIEATNEVENLIATRTYPAPGASVTKKFSGVDSRISAEISESRGSSLLTVTAVIPMKGSTLANCPTTQATDDCLSISSHTIADTGSTADPLPTTTHTGTDKVSYLTGSSKTIYYTMQLTVPRSLVITTYKADGTVIDSVTRSADAGWNNGRIDLNTSDATHKVGFKLVSQTLNGSMISAVAKQG